MLLSMGNDLRDNCAWLQAQDTCELFFDDVRLSEEHVLGKANHGFYYLMQELPQERLLIAVRASRTVRLKKT